MTTATDPDGVPQDALPLADSLADAATEKPSRLARLLDPVRSLSFAAWATLAAVALAAICMVAPFFVPSLRAMTRIGGSDPIAVPLGEGTAVDVRPYYAFNRIADEIGDVSTVPRAQVALGAKPGGLLDVVAEMGVDGGFTPKSVLEIGGLTPGQPTLISVAAIDRNGNVLGRYEQMVTPRAWIVDATRRWLLLLMLAICGAMLAWIVAARRGVPIWVRHIPALDAVDEAVGRATEMGKPCLFVPGILDLNEIQTIAGLTLLGHVAERTADYRSDLEVPTSKSLVMTAAREAVEASYLTAGRSESYSPDAISYITDEQFGYVAYLSGWMVRERPAACFYLGAFFAESLILAETGNAIGAVQMAGAAEPSQLPFFVAACDYTLIGEEFFAASAYLSGDPDQLGSLRGQDTAKLIAIALIVVGAVALTLGGLGIGPAATLGEFLRETVLSSG